MLETIGSSLLLRDHLHELLLGGVVELGLHAACLIELVVPRETLLDSQVISLAIEEGLLVVEEGLLLLLSVSLGSGGRAHQ